MAVTSQIHLKLAVPQTLQYSNKESGEWFHLVQTDKASYSPGDTAGFNLTFLKMVDNKNLHVIYRHLSQPIDEQIINLASIDSVSWKWKTPNEDFKGYLIELILKTDDTIEDRINIALDVSSNWSKFPRYGFLSKYPYMNKKEIKAVISKLNRYHINGLQFYDWHYKHHLPLKGTPNDPAPTWNDIANRINYFSTIQEYIVTAQSYNMMTMAYNLLYGAWTDAHLDGVSPEWRLFLDSNHENPKFLDFSSEWASDIYIMDPSNQQWKNYIISKTRDALLALPFDGWHVDQLGEMENLWNYQGDEVIVKDAFESFLKEAKASLDATLVMNSVNQYGQPEIALGPVDFLYAEVWGPNNKFVDLARIITDNLSTSGGKLNTVLAAYVNHDLAEVLGTFNTPAVLLCDAVIFASGGAHIELGEHMLGHEYFPNNNLQMSEELKNEIVHYYDFLVAYENLLRDNVKISTIQISATTPLQIKSYPQLGAIWAFAKEKLNRQIVHLINFTDATTLSWRDNTGIQREPVKIEKLQLQIETDQKVGRIWMASPDLNMGSAYEIEFNQENGQVSFTLLYLKYWDMIVVEYEGSVGEESRNDQRFDYLLGQNYPNPFNSETVIPYSMQQAGSVGLNVFNVLGEEVYGYKVYSEKGINKINFNAGTLNSGIYLYRLITESHVETRKMVLLK